MSRRGLLQRGLLGGVVAVTGTQLFGCSTGPAEDASSPAPSAVEPSSEAPSTAAPTETTTPTPSAEPPTGRVLLAYFSRAGENYYYGGRRDLEVGNTEVLAKMLDQTISVDLHQIKAADPYSADYDDTVARN
ncbi:MAG: hypothetical protein ABWY56_08585, partial [Propionibacteriaceae bacterium]